MILGLVVPHGTWNTFLHHHNSHAPVPPVALTLQADSSQVWAPPSFLPTYQVLLTVHLCAGEQSPFSHRTSAQHGMLWIIPSWRSFAMTSAFQSVLGHRSCVLLVWTLEKQGMSCGETYWTGFRRQSWAHYHWELGSNGTC